MQAFQGALLLEPLSTKANYNFGVSLHKSNRFDDAVVYYKKALTIDSENVNCHYNLGLIYQEQGKLHEASEEYLTVLLLNPSHYEAKLNHCNILMALDDLIQAEQCYIEVLQIKPDYVRGLVNLASLYVTVSEAKDYLQRAVDLYLAALEIDPSNRMAKHGLKALRSHHASTIIDDSSNDYSNLDPEYVRELFDSYSFHFETSLRSLNYSSHILISDLLMEYLSSNEIAQRSFEILDLGSGTGLFCDALKNISGAYKEIEWSLTAVDVSAKMLEKAKQKNCYQEVLTMDINEFLSNAVQSSSKLYSAIAFVDVLVYFGDIRSVLEKSFILLEQKGVLLFTVENLYPPEAQKLIHGDECKEGETKSSESLASESAAKFALQKTGRFGHSREYILQLAGELGFKVFRLQDCIPRNDNGSPVYGLAVALVK